MAKKLTIKQQKEQKEKAALLQRVRDIYSGSYGREWLGEDFATAAQLSLIIPALNSIFGNQIQDTTFIWNPHNIERFDNPESATDFLFKYGFRA